MEYLMNPIGERIRDLRQKRGFTQKSLAGSHMTRNMLSLIENGQASPSLATILYLAEQLDVPAGYFFAVTEEDEKRYYKMMVIPEIKQLFRDGLYEACEQRIQEIPSHCLDDEIAYISAQCFLHTALQCAGGYALKSADSHLAKADLAIQSTIYAGNDLVLAVRYYRDLIALLLTGADYSEETADIRNASSFVSVDMLRYMEEILVCAREHCSPAVREWNTKSFHDRHLYALYLMHTDQVKQAVMVLRELLDSESLPFYMQYRVCSDLEEAANADGDFRSAYNAARRKLELMENAKK